MSDGCLTSDCTPKQPVLVQKVSHVQQSHVTVATQKHKERKESKQERLGLGQAQRDALTDSSIEVGAKQYSARRVSLSIPDAAGATEEGERHVQSSVPRHAVLGVWSD